MNLKFRNLIKLLLLSVFVYLRYFNEFFSELMTNFTFLFSILTFILFALTVNLVSIFLKYSYSKKNKLDVYQKNNVHFGIENISNLVLTIGFLVLIVSLFGIHPKEFITSMSIVAAAIALITKDYIADFFSGIYLSFSKAFEINDYVLLDNYKGKILEINMFKTKLLSDDDDVVIIPNAKVHNNEIINYTKRDIRRMNIDFQLDLKYLDNIERFEKQLITAVKDFSEYIEEKSYNLKVVDMKKDYVDLKFQYTLKELDIDLQRKIRKKTIRKVFSHITSMKVELAQED